jgi:hypothetical protein
MRRNALPHLAGTCKQRWVHLLFLVQQGSWTFNVAAGFALLPHFTWLALLPSKQRPSATCQGGIEHAQPMGAYAATLGCGTVPGEKLDFGLGSWVLTMLLIGRVGHLQVVLCSE